MIQKMRYLNKNEEDQTIIKIVETLLDKNVPYAGGHRLRNWEKGWKENLNKGDVIPKYFGKWPVQRLNGEFVMGLTKNYEINMLYSIIDKLARKYLKKVDHIYEFGCGTGHNLLRVERINKSAEYYGLDWSEYARANVTNLGYKSYHFDFFNPNYKIVLKPNSAVYTVASLEQVGKRYEKFVEYLLKNKPSIVVHIEPIPELLDPTKLLDYLSIKYMEKRKYLSGYLEYLKDLEYIGKIEIIEAKRSGIGSMFIDGYSIIVWKPL